MDYERTREVLTALEREGVQYVIFGAVALNLQGLARATLDLDIFIAPDEANIERLKAALKTVFDDPHLDEITAEDLLGDYPAVQYVPPEGTFHIDILTRLGEGSKMIVTGDPSQVDLPPGQKSGLVEVLELLADVQGIHFTRFSHRDVVRHELVARIVRAYDAKS